MKRKSMFKNCQLFIPPMPHSNINSLPDREKKKLGSSTSKVIADNKFKTVYFTTSLKQRKQYVKEEKMHATNIFSISCHVSQRRPLRGHRNTEIFGKGQITQFSLPL